MKVDIASAEEGIFSGMATMLFAPAEKGEIGVLPGHAPLISVLKPGQVCVRDDDGDKFFFVSGGFIEVQPDHVVVLADAAVRANDLDEGKIKAAQQRAQEAMENAKSDFDVAKAESEIATAVAQLKMISRVRDKLNTQGMAK